MLAVALAVVVIAITAASALAAAAGQSGRGDPFAGRTLYLEPDSLAARAAASSTNAAERAAATEIAAQPTAVWLTPEAEPAGTVGRTVAAMVAAAESDGALPVFVVYGITDRDCGGESAGGLAREDYLAWVDEIATGLGRATSVVVLEPDALAFAPECGNVGNRTALVAEALTRLDDSGAAVYLDGGHSAWLTPGRMAGLLRDAGIERARGFATNVSNTQATDDEIAYARQVSERLGGTHAIIDTSRNGVGPAGNGAWCNVPDRALGDAPHDVDDPIVDAFVWVKPPGESDGTCNGGPPAGQWWPAQAIELVANASN